MNLEHLKAMALDRLSYDAETGVFTWKSHPRRTDLNGRKAGSPHNQGYWAIKIAKRPYLAHRLAWLMVHGDMPKLMDHINGNRIDNRIANLRPATLSQNSQNCRRELKVNGLPQGVRMAKSGRYEARIAYNRKQSQIGTFDTASEAETAYKMERKLKFGDFAPL